MRVGVAELPLHGGEVPRWLIVRMIKLARVLAELIIDEHGPRGFIERVSDPVYFQAINNIIGMDWDSSGSTTVTTAVLKSVLNEADLGVRVAGGKGRKSRDTPQELEDIAGKYQLDASRYIETSYLVAKVDTAAVQAGYQLYHHTFFLAEDGTWAVVQQAMKPDAKVARRIHWYSEKVIDPVNEPHAGVAGFREPFALNTIAREASGFRRLAVDLVEEGPSKLEEHLRQAEALTSGYQPLFVYRPYEPLSLREVVKKYSRLGLPRVERKSLEAAREKGISSYTELLKVRGVGPSTIRALALVAELVYETPPSWRDPVTHPIDPFKFAYAVGGKDGVPFPVDKRTYDELLSILNALLERKIYSKWVLRQLATLTRSWSPSPEEKKPT
ncbi:MAG: DUF763 domain-containing protein [Infirmifilum sp.]